MSKVEQNDPEKAGEAGSLADCHVEREAPGGFLPLFLRRAFQRGKPSGLVGLGLEPDAKERVRDIENNTRNFVGWVASYGKRLDRIRNQYSNVLYMRTSRAIGLDREKVDEDIEGTKEGTKNSIAKQYHDFLHDCFWDGPEWFQENRIDPAEIVNRLGTRLSQNADQPDSQQSAAIDATEEKPKTAVVGVDADQQIEALLGTISSAYAAIIARLEQRRKKQLERLHSKFLVPAEETLRQLERDWETGQQSPKHKRSHKQAGLVLAIAAEELGKITLFGDEKTVAALRHRLSEDVAGTLKATLDRFTCEVVDTYTANKEKNVSVIGAAYSKKGIGYFDLSPGDRAGQILRDRMDNFLVRVILADGSTIVRWPRHGETPIAEIFKANNKLPDEETNAASRANAVEDGSRQAKPAFAEVG